MRSCARRCGHGVGQHERFAHDDEVLRLIEEESLHGTGIGYIDSHLLASTRLTNGGTLWTRDLRLASAAARLGLAIGLPH